MEIKILKNVMVKNNAIGSDNRKLYDQNGLFVLNMTSSPGAGKTTLIKTSLEMMGDGIKCAVIEGDLYTSRDAERLQQFDIPLVQINTEGGCHLDARMIHHASADLDMEGLDLLFIENVGNLVCPSEYDLGEHKRVLLYSVTEGEDKPMKYRNMFESADLVLINKVELAELCGIDLDFVENEIRSINPEALIMRISALKEETLSPWISWLEDEIKTRKPLHAVSR